MDLVKTRQDMMESEDIKQLYNIELDLTEYIAQLHKNVVISENPVDESEEKGKLSIANALLGICRERQAEVKDTGRRLNHNFRKAAKETLDKKLYDDILNKAYLPRKSFIEQNQPVK